MQPLKFRNGYVILSDNHQHMSQFIDWFNYKIDDVYDNIWKIKLLLLCDIFTGSEIHPSDNVLLIPRLTFSILYYAFNTLRPRQDGSNFPDYIFKCILWNEYDIIISKGPISNIPALLQIMAWQRPGDKPSSEPIMVSLPTHISVTRSQWVNCLSVNETC